MANNSALQAKLPPGFIKDPDATEPDLVAKRREQWRHFSRDPYKPPMVDEKSAGPPEQEPETQKQGPMEYVRRLRHPGSGWTLLFYDLAWTATFATLSQSGSFIEPLDALSYFGFFAAVLWLWASQTLYCVHFYTNDWFHLTSLFIQLFIFGLLAATTRGYHLTNYITRSPGGTDLNPDLDQLSDVEQLERFNAERTDLFSARAMAVAFLLLIQYLRVCFYARWGEGAKARGHIRRGRFLQDRVHPQVYAILVGLIFSNLMLFAAMGIMFSSFGTTVLGASLRLGLWVCGFLLEIISHLWLPVLRLIARHQRLKEGQASGPVHWTEDVNPLPLAKVDLCERFDTITTIILGEGINSFAGTLASILTAAKVGKAVLVNVASAAFTVWFIAYLYFEGPKSGSSPEGEGLRRLVWMVIYLPFLASIFLLFTGIKNQFLLTAGRFLSTVDTALQGFKVLMEEQNVVQRLEASDPSLQLSPIIKTFLYSHNIIWKSQYQSLSTLFSNAPNRTEFLNQMGGWVMRLSMSMALNSYETLNGDESIPEDIQTLIQNYIDNSTDSLQDAMLSANLDVDLREMRYYQILARLLDASFEGARYILAFAALIPICLGIQCIVHSPPRDRYQWGVITSRLLLGLLLALLLLLNIGKYQEFYVSRLVANQRAGVFLWLAAFWVLPTIAIAYAVEFLLEIVLAYFAKQATERAKHAQMRAEAEAGVRTSAMVPVIGGAEVLNQVSPDLPYIQTPSSEGDNKQSAKLDG